jgi:hypothetical protein
MHFNPDLVSVLARLELKLAKKPFCKPGAKVTDYQGYK